MKGRESYDRYKVEARMVPPTEVAEKSENKLCYLAFLLFFLLGFMIVPRHLGDPHRHL
jgi:hypothetical protein